MIIYLTKAELDYLHAAINVWHQEALKYSQKMLDDKSNDSYGLSPTSCGFLTALRMKEVQHRTASMNADWEKNEGQINLDLFGDLFFKYSVHTNMQSPLFLSIKQKTDQALAERKLALQKQSMFAAANELHDEPSVDTDSDNNLEYSSQGPGGSSVSSSN